MRVEKAEVLFPKFAGRRALGREWDGNFAPRRRDGALANTELRKSSVVFAPAEARCSRDAR